MWIKLYKYTPLIVVDSLGWKFVLQPSGSRFDTLAFLNLMTWIKYLLKKNPFLSFGVLLVYGHLNFYKKWRISTLSWAVN